MPEDITDKTWENAKKGLSEYSLKKKSGICIIPNITGASTIDAPVLLHMEFIVRNTIPL
jgi:hypothetical protein